jgi:hypothetical protein
MDTPPLPADASDWLRAACVGSKFADTEKAVREAKFLYEALKHRAQIERGAKSINAAFQWTSLPLGVVWTDFGRQRFVAEYNTSRGNPSRGCQAGVASVGCSQSKNW